MQSVFFPLIPFCVLSGAVRLLFMWMSPLGKGLLCIPPLDGSAQAASGGESETTAHRSPSVSVYALYKALAVLET
jgi:hypothetical protein